MRMQEINFYKNFELVSKYFINNSVKNKNKYKKALTEIYFYANSLRIENRELEDNLSKWQAKYDKQINNNNGNTIHIS